MLIDNPTLGFIGLGEQGEPIARNLVSAGFDVLAFDVREEALRSFAELGGRKGASVAGLATEASIVFVCVVNDEQLRSVMLGEDGLLANMMAGGTIVVNSTVSLSIINEISPLAVSVGIDLVDAPLTGGGAGARARSLVYFAGGSEAALDLIEPILKVSAARVLRVGGTGHGIRSKLTHQLVLAGNYIAAREGWRLGRGMGLSDDTIREVIQSGRARSTAAETFAEGALSENGRNMIGKDLGLCVSEASNLGISAECAATLLRALFEEYC